MAYNFELKALGIHRMVQYWYQYVILGILGLSVITAVGYILWLVYCSIRNWNQKRRITVLPSDTKEFIQRLSRTIPKFLNKKVVAGKPTSFGVYYGNFSNPPTQEQHKILTQWHTVILDPTKPGVYNALVGLQQRPTYVIGRIDFGTIAAGLPEDDRVGKVKSIISTIIKCMKPEGPDSLTPWNGVLIANWDDVISPGICNEIIAFLSGLNLNVYTEVCAPRFMDKINSTIKVELLSGVVFINGSILPNGERRDFFNLLGMKRALEIVAAQSCLREFAVLMCEVIHDGCNPTNAVIKRSFSWCSYYGGLVWIGHQAALTNASKNFFVQKPEGAFDWLKRDAIIDIQEVWRTNKKIVPKPACDVSVYEALEPIIPGISEACRLYDAGYTPGLESDEQGIDGQHFDWVNKVIFRTVDPLSTSSRGLDYCGLGCFPIGLHVSQSEFDDVVSSQARLLHKNLLKPVPKEQLVAIGHNLRRFLKAEEKAAGSRKRWSGSSHERDLVRQLAHALIGTPSKNGVDESQSNQTTVEVYIGLDTGFRATNCKFHFWGVFDGDNDTTRIYISRNATDLAGTILHTFLSANRCERSKCFEAEYALASSLGGINNDMPLPRRMLQDIKMLTPNETLIFLQAIAISGSSNDLLAKIKDCCEYELIDVTSFEQLKSLNTISYLRGDITVEDLIATRIQWYRQQKIPRLPQLEPAVELFKTVDRVVGNMLRHSVKEYDHAIASALEEVIQHGRIDVRADILALAVFCSFRRYAYEEIYLEATDRCPILNDQPDQAIVYAELWALGSHTESYLDISPKALGKILFDKYREYYDQHQPPLEADDPANLATAYPSAKIDTDREGLTDLNKGISSKLKGTAYIGVFAVPALIDILLLTTIGRGLYLSAYMTETEQQMSTDGLVIALVICGAVSSWIGAGGSYYLWAMVYPTMNMFMLTRFIGGVVFTSVAAIISFVIVTILHGFVAAVIFVTYLMVLSTYLFLLGLMSTLQFVGTPLPSGRTAIGQCMCILLLSPIITTYVPGHDIIIYVSVLCGFCVFFLFRARYVISRWNTWLLDVPGNTDQEVLDWYLKTHHGGDDKAFANMTAPAAMELSRSTLFAAVTKERSKSWFTKSTSDSNVRKLAKAYPTTVLLLDWYSRYMKADKPLPYTSTWNLQTKVALNTLRSFDKGLRLHNGFIHWRHGKAEIANGVLYFLLALLDRWIELICGGRLVGLIVLSNSQSRIAVGLGLIYYLFGAVSLDIKCHPLYDAVKKVSLERLRSAAHLNDVAKEDAYNKQRLYWGTLLKFTCIHVWGLAFVTSFFWVYVEDEQATIVLLAYIFAYTGLLWFQYNRVFAGAKTLPPLIFSVALGFAVGLPLRILRPTVFWNDVVALGVATWTCGILTFRMVNLSAPQFKEIDEAEKPISYSQKAIGPNNDFSNDQLDDLFDELVDLPKNEKLPISLPSPIANEVLQILTSAKHASKCPEVKAAFPDAFAILDQAIVSFDSGETIVESVSSNNMSNTRHDIFAVSRKIDRRLKIFVGINPQGSDWTSNWKMDCHAIAEAIVHEFCEHSLGLSHSDAVIAEFLVSSKERLELPRRMKRQLEYSSIDELYQILNRRDEELVRHLCFNARPDLEWEYLPNDVRATFVKRVCSKPYTLNETQLQWMSNQLNKRIPYQTYLARRDLHASLTLLIDEYAAMLLRDPIQRTVPTRRKVIVDISADSQKEMAPSKVRPGFFELLLRPIKHVNRTYLTFMKFLFLAFIAEPEFQRELAYVLNGRFLRVPITFVATRFWIYARIIQSNLFPFFFFYRRKHVQDLARFMKYGTVIEMKKRRLVIYKLKKPTTAFIEEKADGTIELCHYSGEHKERPKKNDGLLAINHYSKTLEIIRRQEFDKGKMVNDFVYKHSPQSKYSTLQRKRRIPAVRICIDGKLKGEELYYARNGFVRSGRALRDGRPYEFAYEYRRKAKFDDELLRVRYNFDVDSSTPQVVYVWWCVPPVRKVEEPDRWIPYSKVTQVQYVQNGYVTETKWTYDHKCHPVISTVVDGEEAETPDMIRKDHLHVLKKPASTSYADEDPLLPFTSVRTNFIKRLLRLDRRSVPVSTSRARTFLWREWKDSVQLDGVTARWLDEEALRSNRILKPYWKARDAGNLHKAIKYLRTNGDAIMANVDIDHGVSAWTALAFKMSDFFSLGQGGDTSINTRTTTGQINDTHEQLHVLATDVSTWPCEGGGVSCCRRDLVDNLQNVKWHIVAEVPNDYSVPRFQIEHNVQSVKVLPLWGLDFLTPTHGIIENQLDTAMEAKLISTNDIDIKEKFFPILDSLVRGVRAIEYDAVNIAEFTKMLIDLNTYFENRNWGAVWKSHIVSVRWRELWLSKSMENTRPISLWFELEKPTLGHLDDALELYSRYLFIFSIAVPEKIPTVFQASHHSIGALYGIVCKIKRGCSFQVWDHSIIWRECNTFLSAAQNGHFPFIRNSLVGLMRLAAVLNLHHADVVLPCTNFFNPGWEVELGTCEGALDHRKKFARKIDPVVNGICNMDSFDPIDTIKTQKPTVTMLSHVQYVKDIKCALLAADIIVNEWGFKDYRLDIYGGLDRMPAYTVECQELLAVKSLRGYVTLKGYGNPKAVLADTWVFLNSSISEGLPLAIGEAALTGAPIVCTDVGATFQVLTDPDDPKKRYGTVVAPNDPRALARAQISLLAVMDEWEDLGEDDVSPGPTPDKFTPDDVARITKRMYDKTPQRRKLGMQLRKVVQKSFSGDRYLREHEQMLWIGKHKNEAFRRQAAIDANQTIIEMLDDVYARWNEGEYRPEFLRYISGYSAFNSNVGSETHVSAPSSTFNAEDLEAARYGSPYPDQSKLGDEDDQIYYEEWEKGDESKFAEVSRTNEQAEKRRLI